MFIAHVVAHIRNGRPEFVPPELRGIRQRMGEIPTESPSPNRPVLASFRRAVHRRMSFAGGDGLGTGQCGGIDDGVDAQHRRSIGDTVPEDLLGNRLNEKKIKRLKIKCPESVSYGVNGV